MGVICVLRLMANCESDATKINEYAKKLNKKYNLELCTGEYGGLEFCDFGFGYIDVDADNLMNAEKMIDEIVAHFPDMKLTFQGSVVGECYQVTKESQNGVLVTINPWRVGVHCEKESFDELLTHIPFIEQQGFEVCREESESSLYWEYDHISEEEICNDTIVGLSKKMPQVTIYSFKEILEDGAPAVETFCILNNGVGEWQEDLVLDALMWSECKWNVIKDPESSFIHQLEKSRGGNAYDEFCIYCTLRLAVEGIVLKDHKYKSDLSRWLPLLKPEDKQWLMEADQTLYDCIVLAGMHHNWHSEDSNIPLFEYNAEDEKRLFERVSTNWAEFPLNGTYYEQKGYVYLLKFTNLNYRSILRNYIEGIEPYMDKTDERLQWFRKEIGDIYD